MTEFNFEKSLTIILEKLNKKEWATPLIALEVKFRKLDDGDYSFALEIINMLHIIENSVDLDSSIPLPQLAAIRLASLDCWTFRFYKMIDNDHQEFINPLSIQVDYLADSTIKITQSSSPYPSTDIIKRWARENLR